MYNTADYMEEPEITMEERQSMLCELMNEIYGWWDDMEEDEEKEE